MAAPARYPTTKGVTENAMNGLIGYLMGLPHETGFGSASTAERVGATPWPAGAAPRRRRRRRA